MLFVCWSLLRDARQFSKLLTQGSLHSIVWLQTKGSCAAVMLSALRDPAADTKGTQLVHPVQGRSIPSSGRQCNLGDLFECGKIIKQECRDGQHPQGDKNVTGCVREKIQINDYLLLSFLGINTIFLFRKLS